MPRIFALIVMVLALAVMGLGGGLPIAERVAAASSAMEVGRSVVVHYWRPDGDYAGWSLWVWKEGAPGRSVPFVASKDGAVARFEAEDGVERLGFIVRRGEWERKDIDQDRFIELKPRGRTEVWLAAGQAAVHASAKAIDRSSSFVGAFLDARHEITLAMTGPLDDAARRAIKVRIDDDGSLPVSSVTADRGGDGHPTLTVKLSKAVSDPAIARLSIQVDGAWRTVLARGILNDSAFIALDAVLGPTCGKDGATVTTWSPVSSKVELELFEKGLDAPTKIIPLRAGARGIWSIDVPGDHHGVPYRIAFTHYGRRRSAADIHAVAASADSSFSIFADLSRLEPNGWQEDRGPTLAQPTDEILYELHVRDFTIADASCPADRRGSYLGLVHEGSAAGTPTALAHLRRLGITGVHLLPIHDFTAKPDEYNWGYWTALFNVPESNFASVRQDPLAPIRELRQAIAGMHAAGIRVVTDVVYNHTSSSGDASPFDATVPGWFFRTTRDGSLTNDAGCGNSVADERPMVRKYILDSLAHWLRQYHVDGFRFDLLGTHDPATVRAIVERVRSIRPDATLYGEPWTGGGPIRFGKGAQKGTGMAVFNDHLRNALRGDLDGNRTGFASGSGGDRDAVKRGVAGSIDDFTDSPGESVNYVSAHDNLSLVDQLARSAKSASETDREAMLRLQVGTVLLSQGIPFLEGGCEIGRTKGGDHNSYVSGDAVNRFDWERATRWQGTADWIAGMIALRRAHPAFRMIDASTVRRAIHWMDGAPLLAWTIDGRASADPSRTLLVALNGEPTAATLALPDGEWTILADRDRAGTTPIGTAHGSITVAPWSLVVLSR
ncbi:MAG: type I pullulanase [Phycisphaerae bacterium]|nr:type I pullulanase [Phycisphaerae bacterium]